MDLRHRARRISAAPAMAFAVGALLVDLALIVLPLLGPSPLSFALREGFPFRVEVAYLLTLFAQSVAILIGLMLLRRGRPNMASGVFVGLLVLLGLRVISSVLTSIDGWLWQPAVFLGLQAIECVLLLLAARAPDSRERRRPDLAPAGYIGAHSGRRGFLVSPSLTSELSVPDVGDMQRWRARIAVGVLTLAVGAVLVFHPWSEPEIPTASKYSSASDLARDLNEHGLGCAHPAQPRLFKLFYRYMAIWVDPRRFLPETLVCSVDGRPVVLSVLRALAFKAWIKSQSTPHYTDLQDEAAHKGDSVIEALRRDAVLVGPNWMVMGRHERDSIPALSAIRGEIGGTLVVATSPTTPASLPTSNGQSP